MYIRHNPQLCADLICCLRLLQSPCQLLVYILQLSNLGDANTFTHNGSTDIHKTDLSLYRLLLLWLGL